MTKRCLKHCKKHGERCIVALDCHLTPWNGKPWPRTGNDHKHVCMVCYRERMEQKGG